jgi:Na+-transporting methylmalonyl-CoA/oxaloacetate decarboxylase beta subunit
MPESALLVSPVEHGFLPSSIHRGPALYLWPPGRRASQVTVAAGVVCGYDATCEVPAGTAVAIIRRMLTGEGVFVHEALANHVLVREACAAYAPAAPDPTLAPFRRYAAATR